MSEDKNSAPENVKPSPEKRLEKKFNIVAIIAILVIIGVVFYVISKDAASRNAAGQDSQPAVYDMKSSSTDGPVVPPPPAITPAPTNTAKPAPPKPPPVDPWADIPDPVAEIDGKPIAKATLVDNFNSQFPDRKPQGITADNIRNSAFLIANSYVNHQLMLDMARAKVAVNRDEIVKTLQDAIKDLDPAQMNMLKMSLGAQNQTLDAYIQQSADNPVVHENILLTKYGELLEKDIQVTDAELKEAYEQLKEQFFVTPADAPGTIRASHILFAVQDQKDKAALEKAREQAVKTLAELRNNPEKFAEIAAAVSDCPSKQDGGALGAFARGAMVKPFEDVAFKLKEGEISEPVKTQFGYHIIRRDPPAARQEKSLAEAKDELIRYLKRNKVQEILVRDLENARQVRNVKILIPEPAPPSPPKAK